jgi:putative endonuclease
MPDSRQITGREGEDLAALHLQAAGYHLLERGYRTRLGEIDLIASHRGILVFVEVKTRRGARFGTPAEAVHPLKQARLARLALQYLGARGRHDATCRFDVIAVTLRPPDAPRVEHFEDAFRLD